MRTNAARTVTPRTALQLVIGRPPRPTRTPRRPGASGGSPPDYSDFWTQADYIASRVPELGTLKAELERAIARNVIGGVRNPRLEAAILRAIRGGHRTVYHEIVARAFWWGCHLEIPSSELAQLVSDPEYSVSALQAIGRAMPILESWLPGLGELLDAHGHLLRRIDAGQGVYVNMPWSAPGNWLPSPVV